MDGSMQLWGNVYDNSQKLKPFSPMKNNIKDFFDTGVRYNNSVSFNGATDKSTYFVSFSQISDDGMIPTNADSYNKYTFSTRGSHKVGHLTFSSSVNYAYQKNKFVSTGQGKTTMYNSIMQTPRDISIIGLKDLDDPFNNPGYYYTPYGVTNPYYVLNNFQNQYESERFYGKFQMDYDFLKYFKFTYRFGLDTSTGHHNMGDPNLSAMYAGTPDWSDALKSLTGSVSQRTERRREINQDILLNFEMPVSDFNINALVGFNGNERQESYLDSQVNNLTIPTWFDLKNSADKPIVEQHKQLRRLMGALGQFEASWKNMLYATGVTTLGFLLCEIIPSSIIHMFTTDTELINTAVYGLRITFAVFPIVGFQMVATNFFTSIGMAKKAIFLSMSRQLLFLLPCLLILPSFYGVTGVWFSSPISDLVATVITSLVLIYQFRQFKTQDKTVENISIK